MNATYVKLIQRGLEPTLVNKKSIGKFEFTIRNLNPQSEIWICNQKFGFSIGNCVLRIEISNWPLEFYSGFASTLSVSGIPRAQDQGGRGAGQYWN